MEFIGKSSRPQNPSSPSFLKEGKLEVSLCKACLPVGRGDLEGFSLPMHYRTLGKLREACLPHTYRQKSVDIG